MEGWIKLHRGILDWQWYDHVPTKVVFLHCLLKANHKDKEWRGVQIKRGEFVTSYGKLAEETGYSVKQIRTILGKLKGKELEVRSDSQRTVIQVVKYDDYQIGASEGQANGQSKGKQRATTKNEKNENNKENNDLELDLSIFPFDDFWNMYDKKKDRAKCEKLYKKINEVDREKIKQTLPVYIESTKDNKQYRKDPATYLNNRSWENEIIPQNNITSQSNRKPGFQKDYSKYKTFK